ncbi:M56 family metallopeptidase [Sphingomonas sp. PB2P19]|uniref:M56 family metallopeptidase n=1 Tax=Sphingomonas rhamnosi TaxID=3096156 RepID=UPI002FC767FA
MSAALPGWAIEALIASTVLMIIVLAIRTPVRRLFGAQVAYALWALPALRLILPPMPQGWHTSATPLSRAGETIIIYVVDPAGSAAVASAPGPSLGLVAGALWGAGAAAFLVWHFVQHSRFCARMLGTAERLDDEQGVRVIASPAAPGPLAFGIVRRYVAFPRDFDDRYDSDERALALAHEIGHHQRGDLIANWVALIVLALHWFNPIAWRAFRSFRADQELANDARVLAGRSAVDRHIYACAIVKAAHGGAVSAACHLHTITDLKGRLRMLTTSRTSRRRFAIGTVSVAALVAAGLGVTASGTSAAEAIGARIRTDIQPVPPVTPVPPMPPVASVPAVTSVPPMPPRAVLPNAGDVPPMPPVPPVRTGSPTRVMTIRNGERMTMADMPEITERSCAEGRDGDAKQMVIHRQQGARKIMIICSNRIEKAAADGAQLAANSKDIERSALRSAITGLRSARAGIVGNMSMSAEQRAQALAGIDEGIAEVEADIAKAE